jgi:predicted adenylyl cyclase CyaB
MQETEAKIALKPGEYDTIRQRLHEAGATQRGVDEEENLLFDSADGGLRGSGQGLRLRSFADRDEVVLTYKGRVERGSAYKSREEIEVRLSDLAGARRILERLGFRATTRYAKRREHWRLDDVEVALDRLEFGDYIEIEGTELTITAALERLGLARRKHIARGYAELARRAGIATEPGPQQEVPDGGA